MQPRITHLIDVLNQQLPPNQQITLYDFPVDEPQNIAYLRGIYLRLADFTAQPYKVPYQLVPGARRVGQQHHRQRDRADRAGISESSAE